MTSDARSIVELVRGEIAVRGWSKTARLAGVDRCTLHRCFGPGAKHCPSFETLSRVAAVVGVKIWAATQPTL